MSELPSLEEIDSLREFWLKEKQHPSIKYLFDGFPDMCLSILVDTERLIKQAGGKK